jgi:dTMP kinase
MLEQRGLFLALEGIEGVGKSTQQALLVGWLESLGISATPAREPGGTRVGEAIREVVLHRRDLDMPAETELFLILGSRAAFVRDVVRPTLAAGRALVSDRFDLSTFAYQGYGRGLPVEEVEQANRLATRGLRPDLYLVLDLPLAEALRRQEARGASDRIESAGAEFMMRVHDGYRELARREPRAELVEGTGSPEEVHERMRSVLRRRFPETFVPAAG